MGCFLSSTQPPPLKAKKIKFLKKWKKPWRYHFIQVYQKSWLDDVWFLRYGALQTDRQKNWHIEVNRRLHIHADLFNSYLVFGHPMTNFWSLSRGQPHLPNVNHGVSIVFCFRGHRQPHNNEFLKTWDELQRDPQTHRVTET